MPSRLSLYWHTLRHLRPVQLYGRIAFQLARPRPDTRSAPAQRTALGPWVAPARREPSLAGPREFRFLNVNGLLDEIGWDGPEREKLWRYNQHYFDDLNAVDTEDRHTWHEALLRDWVTENPPAGGNGWEPYPTSLRIVNWVKWSLSGNALPQPCVESLAVQARWLTSRLEVHLLGNHLFANAKALVFAGLFFQGEEAAAWLSHGLRLLAHEVPEQVLADGGHFERSPMYHAIALEDVLDLCNVAAVYENAPGVQDHEQVVDWRARASLMLRWLDVMCHPDGEISFFNDAAMGIAPSPNELTAYAKRLGIVSTEVATPITWLESSGYARLVSRPAVLLVDMAAVGPDYLPGHAHADTLSFELSLFGQRLLVNSGTSCYGDSTERIRQRGTAAHNTVMVDGADSSEVWGGFRVARRARPINPQVSVTPVLEASCIHDGYRRLPGHVTHQRRWRLTEAGLEVNDALQGYCDIAEARFHFHPTVIVTMQDECGGTIEVANGRCLHWTVINGSARIEDSTWHPRFGVALPNCCLVVRLEKGRVTTIFEWDGKLGDSDAHPVP
jgi:uncharacterized heparinase superfamily protein